MIKHILHHLFLPKESNNYRARVLHHKFLLFFTIVFFSLGLGMSFIRTNYPTVLGSFADISAQQLLDLTNQKRQEAGLSPLGLNSALSQAAAGKASDMFAKDYWAHISPDGTPPWVFIKSSGYGYVYAGENLARGFTTPAGVVDAWMASTTHRENMLSSKYNDVGFAIETGKLSGEDTVLVVEMLGSTSFATRTTAPEQKLVQEEQKKPVEVVVATGSPTTVNTINSKQETLAVEKLNANQKLAVTSLDKVNKPLVNGLTFSVISARVVISLFMFILILDMIIIERKKIVRFVGHNLDHVIFFSLLLLLILVLARGAIL